MFGRVPGTRPNISESHSEVSTRVPFCIETHCAQAPPCGVAMTPALASGRAPQFVVSLLVFGDGALPGCADIKRCGGGCVVYYHEGRL